MANRYDIIHIDFQASAKGANAAIESIRKEAESASNKVTELKAKIADGKKTGVDDKILVGWNEELRVAERRFKQFSTAQKELVKGMRALDEGVKMFNDGSLQQMNAAFQKTVNNAAKLAQSKLETGTKEWRQMGALMQETEQNYARMQRDTDQLIESLQNGGTVFRKTLEDEKKGLQDLLQVLPYMGTEYRKAEEQLQFLTKTTDEMVTKERQLKGEIVTTDDARRVSVQLTKEGADAARQRAQAADAEIEKGKQTIATLEEERRAREDNARAMAERAAKYREDQQMHEDEIDRLRKEIETEQQLASTKKNGVEAMKKKAQAAAEKADDEVKKQADANRVYEEAKTKVENLRKELADMGGSVQGSSRAAATVEAVKTGAEGADTAVQKLGTDISKINQPEAPKENPVLKSVEEGAKAAQNEVGKLGEEQQKLLKLQEELKEKMTREQQIETLIAQNKELKARQSELKKEREELILTQKDGAEATNAEANAFRELSKEQAKAILEQKQQLSTFKKEGDKWSITNRTEAQQFLFDALGEIEPNNVGKTKLSLENAPDKIGQLLSRFQSRYGIQGDSEAIGAVRSLLSEGGLVKEGFMNKNFINIQQNTANIDKFNKDIKDLTAVVNGETKAEEKNAEAKRTVAEIDEEIAELDRQSAELSKQTIRLRNGQTDATGSLTQKNKELTESQKERVAAIKQEIEAVKQMSKEEAKAAVEALKAPSTVGFKGGKMQASDLEEVQSFLVSRFKKYGSERNGTLSVAAGGVDQLISDFQDRYGWKDDKKNAKTLLKQALQSKDGLFGGVSEFDLSSDTKSISVQYIKELYDTRTEKTKALIAVSKGVKLATNEVTEATKKDTESAKESTKATEGQTKAIKDQTEEVARRKAAFDKMNADYEAKNDRLKDMRQKLGNLPRGVDGELQRSKLKDDIRDYDADVVKPARKEKNRLKSLWEKSAKKLADMMNPETEASKQSAEAQNQEAAATDKATESTKRKTKAKKESAQSTEEDTKKSAELAAKEKELADAEGRLTEAKKAKETQDKKAADATKVAEAAATNATTAENKHIDTLENLHKEQEQHRADLEKLNEENKDTIALNEEAQKKLAETNGKIQEQGEKIRDAERVKAQANTEGIEKTEQAIRLLQEENRQIDTNSDQWKENTSTIQHLQQALDEMKGKPALMMMTERMERIPELSDAALTETRRFWQGMADGAEKGSEKLAKAEEHLKSLAEEEKRRTDERNMQKAGGIRHGGYLTMSEEAVREGIAAAREYQQTLSLSDAKYKELSVDITKAEEYLRNFGLEAQRSARRQQEADALMRKQLEQGTALSESALKTQQQYWQRLIDDPKTAAGSIEGYRAELEKTISLQKQQAEAVRDERAAKLGGDLKAMSEGEIREAIEAGKQLIQTYASAGKDASDLAKKIVAAEEHIKNYGVEAQRAAVREAKAIEEANKKRQETMDLMIKQWNDTRSQMSESALKAHERYWQQLIDDPKTAADNLDYYRENLEKVQAEIEIHAKQKVRNEGEKALDFFRGSYYMDNDGNLEHYDKTAHASADELKQQADALKKYRDSLPRDTEAEKIEEINRYLEQVGMTAKGATEEVMELDKALELADTAGKEGFLASPQEMQMATKALEKRREEVIKNIKANRDLGRATDDEEKELADLTKKLRDLKFEQDNFNMSQEKMQMLMEKPTNAVNLEELREAIKRADGELRRMEGSLGQNSEEYKTFAERVKTAKNTLKEMEGQARASATAWEKAWSRLKTYVALYMGFNALWQKLTGTFSDMMELSDKMGEVRKTTGFAADEVAHLSENLKSLDVRTPVTQLMEISAAAGQLGLKTIEDVEGFTVAANKLMIALPEMGKEAATEMMRVAIATGEVDKIRKQMEEGTVEGSNATAVAMEKIASTIDRLRASSASTAPEITDFVKRLGAVGAQSGISIDQISALGSTVSSLGMRVEMSATALSRMIPAIKNNAFQVAKAIKVEPNVLRNLFETGRGMEAILMIFQHIKDAGMDEDSVEKLLGMAGMKDVMKQLNQQGARAGIVFAGLSQNVDELRKQLGVATQAYEENIAIQQEFDRMNETTAAKWERFKNEIEEMFVRDWAQSALGGVIDAMRWLVNVITGNVEPALKGLNIAVWAASAYFVTWKIGIGTLVTEGFGLLIKAIVGTKNAIVALTTAKGLRGLADTIKLLALWTKPYIALQWKLVTAHNAVEKAAIRAKLAENGLAQALSAVKANAVMAVVAAVGVLVWKIHEWNEKAKEAAREAGRFEAEAQKNIKTANKMIDTIGKARVKVEDAEEAVRKARKELEEAKKANDGTAEAVKRLKDAETELLVQEEKKRIAMAEHKRLIEQFNGQYSKYLGFMLSEVSSNLELAKARDLVNAKLRETITLKQQEAGLERVEKDMGGKRDEKYGDVKQRVYDRIKDPTKAARAMKEIVDAAQRQDEDLVMKTLTKYGVANGLTQKAVHAYMDELKTIKESQDAVIAQSEGELKIRREESQIRFVNQVNEAFRTYNSKLGSYKGAEGDDKARIAAEVLQQMDQLREMQQSASSYYKMGDKTEEARYKRQAAQLIGWQGYSREELLRAAGKYYTPRKDINGEYTSNLKDETNGGWGASHEASSTDWKNMTAEQLVARRKQMKDFVNAIQTDSDVQSVLGEDAALKKAIENGMASDMRTVIEWYNTERLKIQDELHARHLTNTGDWMDPKQQKARRKRLQDDMRAYLEELDAYYTERKTRIQEAGNEEGVTEAEVQNRTLANEMEWRQRRAELQLMYSAKAKQVAQDEQDAIADIIAERTGDDAKFIKATIDKTVQFSKAIRDMNEQGAKEYRKFQGDLDLGSQKDYNRQQLALHKHLKAIQDIIDKERPFNGITKNLRENLVTMDILTADMRREYQELLKAGKDMTDFNRRQAEEEVRRTTFLLGEAENAYSTTVEQVMKKMADNGMEAWAEELKASPKMQEALMAQLRSTYDAIQEAIKKEASLMKKQAEIMWNNILLPGGDGKTTVKDAFEQTIARLGIEQGRVSRANSMIGAGASSDRVADRLAVKQMQLQLTMQEHYYNLMRKQGLQRIKDLERQVELAREEHDIEKAKRLELDKQHAEMSLRLATTKEQNELLKQQEEIIARTEESEARLYQQLKEWGDLITSSVRDVFEASNAGNKEYYNELAKMKLTGKGGPGAGTYIVTENAGTEDATAHYEHLDERQALERQHEIEQQNAQAEAWKKVMDDLNQKMSEQITDQINAMMQNAAVEANTSALGLNTQALVNLTGALAGGMSDGGAGGAMETFARNAEGFAVDAAGQMIAPVAPAESSEPAAETPSWTPFWQMTDDEKAQSRADMEEMFQAYNEISVEKETERAEMLAEIPGYTPPVTTPLTDEQIEQITESQGQVYDAVADMSDASTLRILDNQKRMQKGEQQNDQKMMSSGQGLYAKLTAAANLYGVAYQAMSNENLSTAQKFQMIALQAAGNAAIASLTASFSEKSTEMTMSLPVILAKCLSINPIAGAAIFAALTAVLGGLMGMAASKLAKGKSEIAAVTGSSVGAGRLATGMMTYAEGNVNELTDPSTLTPGRQYNVDGADGRTYRARYMGKDAKTHITNGPEFHLVGEKGQEAIIDAHTTRNIRLNEPEIWQSIQTLYNGGRLSATRRRTGRGVRAFADGNLDDFEEVESVMSDGSTVSPEMLTGFQQSLDRNSQVMEQIAANGIKAVVSPYGPDGIVNGYDKYKKEAQRHGEKYL